MAFRFHKAACVVVGTFNMYILHPHWLAKRKIVEEGTDFAAEINLAQPGFRFQFPESRSTWSIAPTRVAIESQAPGTDCGGAVAGILDALPETPLLALGNNAIYQAPLEDLATLTATVRDLSGQEFPGQSEIVTERSVQVSVKGGDHTLVNLQLSIKLDVLELACNVHTELENLPDPNSLAITAAGNFFDDRARSRALAEQFFGASIGDDNTHP